MLHPTDLVNWTNLDCVFCAERKKMMAHSCENPKILN